MGTLFLAATLSVSYATSTRTPLSGTPSEELTGMSMAGVQLVPFDESIKP